MKQATDELLKTHQLIKKLLQGFSIGHERFAEVIKTLRRAVAAHAWFEESIFHAVLRKNRVVDGRFMDELVQEQKDFDNGKLVFSTKTKEGHRTFVAFQPESFVRELFAEHEISEFIPGLLISGRPDQDIWIIRKKDE